MIRKRFALFGAFAAGALIFCSGGTAGATPLTPATYAISDYGTGNSDHGVWFRRFDSTSGVTRFTFTNGQFSVGGTSATLTGRIAQKGNAARAFDINLSFLKVDDTTAVGLAGKCEQGGCDTSGWHYFDLDMGMFTGVGDLAGLDLNLTQIPTNGSYPWQIGFGANSKNVEFGGAMWFEWEVKQNTSGVSVCTSSLNCGNDYHGDFNVNLSLLPDDLPEPMSVSLMLAGLLALGGGMAARQRPAG